MRARVSGMASNCNGHRFYLYFELFRDEIAKGLNEGHRYFLCAARWGGGLRKDVCRRIPPMKTGILIVTIFH